MNMIKKKAEAQKLLWVCTGYTLSPMSFCFITQACQKIDSICSKAQNKMWGKKRTQPLSGKYNSH